MTLDKHQIDGLSPISSKTMPAEVFEQLMFNAGYAVVGSAPAKGNRIKVWWNHSSFRRVEAIYSADRSLVITAYHP
ncbi:MAG: hypothetical protein DWQ53_09085 [Microcystis flos-aquae DF17]|jgi:hypothetical protein|uniref:hypothetical protein n=1 Tax=Microcystis sp. M53598_WE2 TaxID=3030677 RepID=UPI000E3A0058|nr:hypothetical protein [Microcystis sp. M53598_WE2]MBE5228324.1 hypothetical protein [Microcystis aeruginosa PMC 728.11]NCS27618.1 hypothetical protein [Microcystis aeruginosa F13-15]REJ47027.1 MAG: hypothetical protein DWQ53_09085 [Microcystis flos-aquae DF17]